MPLFCVFVENLPKKKAGAARRSRAGWGLASPYGRGAPDGAERAFLPSQSLRDSSPRKISMLWTEIGHWSSGRSSSGILIIKNNVVKLPFSHDTAIRRARFVIWCSRKSGSPYLKRKIPWAKKDETIKPDFVWRWTNLPMLQGKAPENTGRFEKKYKAKTEL